MSIRGNLPLASDTKREVRERLGRALSPVAPSIERVSVRFDDVNGPRGGRDTRCRTKAVLSGFPSVVVEEGGRSPEEALARVVPRLRRQVQRTLGRREAKSGQAARVNAQPLRGRSTSAAAARKRATKAQSKGAGATAKRPARKSTRVPQTRTKSGSAIRRSVRRAKFSPTKRNARGA